MPTSAALGGPSRDTYGVCSHEKQTGQTGKRDTDVQAEKNLFYLFFYLVQWVCRGVGGWGARSKGGKLENAGGGRGGG